MLISLNYIPVLCRAPALSFIRGNHRMGIDQKRMRSRHETTSSSDEDDSVDLLGSNYQVQFVFFFSQSIPFSIEQLSLITISPFA